MNQAIKTDEELQCPDASLPDLAKFHADLAAHYKARGDFEKALHHFESFHLLNERLSQDAISEQDTHLPLSSLEEQLEAISTKASEVDHLRIKIIEIISHELRTPITIIRTSFDLLKMHGERISSEKRDQIYDRMEHALDSLSSLAEDINWIDSLNGASQPVADTYPTHEIQTYLNHLAYKFCGPDRQIELTIDKAGPPHLRTNRQMLNKIISILIKNSCVYSDPKDPIQVQMSDRGNKFQIELTDFGIGIPSEDMSHIWDLFGRGSNVENRRGVGLGLFLAKSLARSLGGELSAHSDGEGSGSRFSLSLPIM